MPGLSLWLCPPPTSPIYAGLESLIGELSDDLFGGAAPKFSPHVTITSNIPVRADANSVVEYAASLINTGLQTEVAHVAYGPAFFKKIYLRIAKRPELVRLAGEVRRAYVYLAAENLPAQEADEKARAWEANDFDPHLSLVYSDEWPISDDKKAYIEGRLDKLFSETDKAWVGGRISLVTTIGPADKWHVLAYKDL
ncbi:2',3'-cyclic-nucleotide 3'-phosphodiesterase [Lipomyces orientalis]|uniref:2',3'-cyclic-nucleotide 3'-phosphodiesterase n=1 Tax=Lipomyces orientalis TaxID=1233043 RepID=A0ACC3TQM1_9ASCO